MVGAVIVNHGRIIAEAYHHQASKPHAEILALHQAGARARGGVLYVTLEPCCHLRKRTPPCVPFLLQSGLSRICIGIADPNPEVNGQSIRLLQRAKIQVTVGVLEEEARALNRIYHYWVTTSRPYVILKGAMTLDGKIATKTGQSKWITGERARQDVHRVRRQVDAVMVGIETVLYDNPELSARGTGPKAKHRVGRQPIRVILDSRLRIPMKANVLRWIYEQPTTICTTAPASQEKVRMLKNQGVEVWVLPQKRGKVSLRAVLTRLGARGVSSLLLEGGSTLNGIALHEGVVNQVRLYIAPRLLGGQDAKGIIGGISPTRLKQAWQLDNPEFKKIGRDWLVIAQIQRQR